MHVTCVTLIKPLSGQESTFWTGTAFRRHRSITMSVMSQPQYCGSSQEMPDKGLSPPPAMGGSRPKLPLEQVG